MGFEQALSGLNAASQNLDTIGNNIANSATVGFKDARAEFADVYASSLWGASSTQVGIGAQVAAISAQFTQGNITTTGNPLDVAINGQGFFREVSNGVASYSRDGEFQLDANGFIVNSSGAQLTGYVADASGNITASPPVPLQLSQTPVPPQATSTASVSLNLNSGNTPPSNPVTAPVANPPAGGSFNPADPTMYNSSTSMTVYDSLGNSHTLSLYFVNTGAGAWDVYGTADGTVMTGTGANGQLGSLTFNSSGQLAANAVVGPPFPWPALTNGATMNFQTLTLPAASTTQYGAPFAVSANTQNGYATGQLAGFSIGKDGTISGRYTNGQTRAQGQIVLANFVNPQGLIAQGGNSFAESAASGAPVVGAPQTGSMGSVLSGSLESSTVDITQELVNMITAQRVYQANAETVKTEDQVQQTLMNLR